MAARKKVSRHGATQPEGERANEQLLLRLPPKVIRRIETMAARTGRTKSQVVLDAIAHVYLHTIWTHPNSDPRALRPADAGDWGDGEG